MHCKCSVCHGKDFNPLGIQIAEQEIIPFLKKEILKLQYPNHPFPLKYNGLLSSCLCYGQVIAYNRSHNILDGVIITLKINGS